MRIAELSVVATVTRSDLDPPQAVLDIDDGIKFTLARNVRLGSVSWRRESVTSPFVHGRIPVHEVKDSAESAIGVYALGDTHATLTANIDELLEAFTQQYSYQIHLQIEGQEYHWQCERADYDVGLVTEHLAARVVPVALSFHRHPIPVTGVV